MDTLDTMYKNKIVSFYWQHKRMPSETEIAMLCGFKSRAAAHKLKMRLIESGVVEKDKKGRLVPKSLHQEVPLLGVVEAGFPSPAEEELCDTMSFDDYLIENKESTYILKVKGDSMIDAGICEGDMVIVERTNSPKVGDIVIADVDGEWTMKYLRRRGTTYYLEPANQNYQPIVPEKGLSIAAVVKAVVRKY